MTEEYNIEERSKDVKPEDVSTDKAEKAGNGTIPATEEPSHSDEEVPSLEEAFKEQAREDEAAQSATFTLRRILGGDFLTAQMLRRQIGVILLCVVFIIIYISNRYSCQKKMLEIDRLNILQATRKAMREAAANCRKREPIAGSGSQSQEAAENRATRKVQPLQALAKLCAK